MLDGIFVAIQPDHCIIRILAERYHTRTRPTFGLDEADFDEGLGVLRAGAARDEVEAPGQQELQPSTAKDLRRHSLNMG